MTWLNAMLKRFICSSNGRKTGEILAYSQRPTFNPETGKDFGKKWANDLYQNTYEPGSTFKTYGLAAAIQEGKFKPDEKYKSGHRNIMGSEISDWNKTGWGRIPMSLGFTYSSNTLMMHKIWLVPIK